MLADKEQGQGRLSTTHERSIRTCGMTALGQAEKDRTALKTAGRPPTAEMFTDTGTACQITFPSKARFYDRQSEVLIPPPMMSSLPMIAGWPAGAAKQPGTP